MWLQEAAKTKSAKNVIHSAMNTLSITFELIILSYHQTDHWYSKTLAVTVSWLWSPQASRNDRQPEPKIVVRHLRKAVVLHLPLGIMAEGRGLDSQHWLACPLASLLTGCKILLWPRWPLTYYHAKVRVLGLQSLATWPRTSGLALKAPSGLVFLWVFFLFLFFKMKDAVYFFAHLKEEVGQTIQNRTCTFVLFTFYQKEQHIGE
jgi:hypothetical protein